MMSDANTEYMDHFRISYNKNLLRDKIVTPVRRNASVLAYLEMAVAMEAVALELRRMAADLKREGVSCDI